MRNTGLLLVFLIVVSCSSSMNKYEKVISDAVQTNSRGTKLELNFKADKIEEKGKVSVADSIKILTDVFNADRAKKIAGLEETVRRNIANIDKEKATRIPSQSMIKFYQSNIDKANGNIDALNSTRPTETAKYEGRNPDEILVIIVRCTYTVDEPLTKVRATETFDFYLSPDGDRCFTQKRVKE